MNLRGKTRQQLEAALAPKSRSELIDLIHSLVTVEQLLKPSEIAARSCLNKRAVLRDIRNGKFGDCLEQARSDESSRSSTMGHGITWSQYGLGQP